MTAKQPTPSPKALVEDSPVIFIGAPTACQAFVPFRNRSDHKLKVKELAVRAPGLVPKKEALRPRFKARLGPGQTASLPVRLPLGRSTPPGVYKATLEVGDQKKTTEIHVLESRSARAHPPRLRLRGRSGEEVTGTVQLENTGNVAFEVAAATLVSLEQEHWVGRAAVVSLRSYEGGPFDDLLESVARELKTSLPAPTEVRIGTDDRTEVPPGETRTLTLRVTLPEDLKLGRSYHGGLELGPTRLGLEVECTGQVPRRKRPSRAKSSPAPAKRRTATKKSRTRSK